MQRIYYKNLTDFYADIKNIDNNPNFNYYLNSMDRPDFTGLSLAEINKSKFSYQPGVETLKKLADITIESPIKVKFWNQFDGFDINEERMYDGMDFLIDIKKIKKLPKTVDIFVNLTEASQVGYKQMLNKTYAALKIVDHLESIGVRTAVYASIPLREKLKARLKTNRQGRDFYIEIALKNYSDNLNMGALCTAISPWFLRHWIFLYILGRNKQIDTNGMGYVRQIPEGEAKGICINTGQCYTIDRANQFINTIKIS